MELKELLAQNDSVISALQNLKSQLDNPHTQDSADALESNFDYFLHHLHPRKYEKAQSIHGDLGMGDSK